MADMEVDYYSPSLDSDVCAEVTIYEHGSAKYIFDETGEWYDTEEPELNLDLVISYTSGEPVELPAYEEKMILQIAENVYWDRYLQEVIV